MPTTMRCSAGACSTRHASINATRPQRVGALGDDLAVDLLAAEPRAGVTRHHLVEETGRQMRGIGLRSCARHRRARIGGEPLDQRDRPRRGGDERARALAQPQPELQHVEGRFGISPLGELVAPGGVELRPAQLLGVLRRKRVSHGAIRPLQPLAHPGPHRPLAARRVAQNAGRPFDHHLAHVVLGLADERDGAVRRVGIRLMPMRQRAHEFSAAARLAGAAPAQQQPGAPGRAVVAGNGRLLMRVREREKVTIEPQQRRRRQPAQHLRRPAGLRGTSQYAAQAHHGIHRGRRACRHMWVSLSLIVAAGAALSISCRRCSVAVRLE